MRPLRVKFVQVNEIRMGSPYNMCRVALLGKWIPDLPNQGHDYQPIMAWSSDGRHLALVRWAVRSNEPGFKVVVVSPSKRSVTQSRRQRGCCESIHWREGAFRFRAVAVIAGSVRPGQDEAT
jgi:hypothetical protein